MSKTGRAGRPCSALEDLDRDALPLLRRRRLLDAAGLCRPRHFSVPEWENYSVFAAWAIANGYADSLSIDRRENDGDYEPGNCRWVTNKVQTRNTRRTVWVEHGGARVSLAEAVEELGLEYHAVYNRQLRAGRAFADVIDEMQGGLPIIDTLNPGLGEWQHGQTDRVLGTARGCVLRETNGGVIVANG